MPNDAIAILLQSESFYPKTDKRKSSKEIYFGFCSRKYHNNSTHKLWPPPKVSITANFDCKQYYTVESFNCTKLVCMPTKNSNFVSFLPSLMVYRGVKGNNNNTNTILSYCFQTNFFF